MKKFWLTILSLLALLCFGACAEQDPGLATYTVSVEKNIAEAGEVTGGGVYEEYKTATLTATTNVGYTFIGWYESNALKSAEPTYRFAVSSDKRIEARWEVATSHTVSIEKNIAEAGTVTGAGTYFYGQTATLTATTEDGYEFVGWYDSDGLVGTQTTYSLVVTGDVTLTAKWDRQSDGDSDWGGIF